MLDALNKAQRYQGRADECRRLAEIGNSSDIRNRYLRMAEYYTVLAEAEEAQGSVAISRAPSPHLNRTAVPQRKGPEKGPSCLDGSLLTMRETALSVGGYVGGSITDCYGEADRIDYRCGARVIEWSYEDLG